MLVTSNVTTSPALTVMAGTWAPVLSVICSEPFSSSLMTRGEAAVPGLVTVPGVDEADPPPEPPMTPLGLRQHAGGVAWPAAGL